jgi:hypothetical protein
MKKIIITIAIMLSTHTLLASDIFRIEIGKDYSHYSDSDLKRRVWELERAVFQLQQKVFEIQLGKLESPSTSASWICRMEAMNEQFTGVGGSKAVAENAVLEKCKASPSSKNGFFCSTAKCEN